MWWTRATCAAAKPAAKAIWGNSTSILVGDFLFARAFNLLVETRSLDILDKLATASTTIAEGEVRQLAAMNARDLPTEEYLAIVEAKTGALFEAAAESGAMSAGGDKFAHAFATYGKNLGLAFQIIDDVLDYGGTTSVIGKSVGDDFRECKITLPVIIAKRRGSDEDRAFWDRAMNVDTQVDADLAHAVHLIRATARRSDRSGSRSLCRPCQGCPASAAGIALPRRPDGPRRLLRQPRLLGFAPPEG